MKKNLTETAFTLIELILAIVLVVVVILGIFSVNMVLSNNNQDYGQRYLVRSQTQITLNHILADATLAVGSGGNVGTAPSVSDTGIVIGQNGVTPVNSFCIHQSPNGADTWVCYTLDTTSTDATYHQISYCNKAYNLADATGFRGANAACSGSSTYLGTALSISNLNSASSPPTFGANGTNAGSSMLFTITIQNCLDISSTQTGCNLSGTSTLPANNPEVQLTGSAFPTQEGMQNNT